VKQVAEMVQANGGLYVADEVQTGFGRTGSHFWGFQNHEGARPDIVTMAKGMGNGFPMAAVVTSAEVADVLGQSLHFNTFGGNPMACAVGKAVLEVIEEEGLQENCRLVGGYMLAELAKLRTELRVVGDVRGKGLMVGLEFVEDKESRKPLALDKVNAIWEATKNAGVLFGKGGYFGNVMLEALFDSCFKMRFNGGFELN
jgi:alanine-glyoxylate transaminase/(R)-3-amino-2-methylpropionate-pyruvate transaminase